MVMVMINKRREDDRNAEDAADKGEEMVLLVVMDGNRGSKRKKEIEMGRRGTKVTEEKKNNSH